MINVQVKLNLETNRKTLLHVFKLYRALLLGHVDVDHSGGCHSDLVFILRR